MTVISRYIYETLLFVKNNHSSLNKNEISHLYETRGKQNYIRPQKHRTKIYERSVSFSGIKIYNSLPNNVKELPYSLYKQKLKLFFTNNALYTIDEFYVNLHQLS